MAPRVLVGHGQHLQVWMQWVELNQEIKVEKAKENNHDGPVFTGVRVCIRVVEHIYIGFVKKFLFLDFL